MMCLAQETAHWAENLPIHWELLMVVLQVVALAYLVYAFHRIARNQVELSQYVKEKLGKDD